jgi:hypothetical protein
MPHWAHLAGAAKRRGCLATPAPLPITIANHHCQSPLPITIANHHCQSPLPITIANHHCQSPLPITIANPG